MALAGMLMYIPYEYGIAYSEHYISASLATVVFRLNPLLMLIFLPVFLRERLSKRQVAALCIGFLGILIGVSQGNPLNIAAAKDAPIVIFVILLALGYALSNVIIKWQMVDREIFLLVSGAALALFFGLAFIATGAHATTLGTTELLIIAYLAITNIFSFYMYIYSFKVLKTTLVTNIWMLSPFLTFTWTYLFFGEKVYPYYIAIALLVGVGMFLQAHDEKGGSYLTSKKPKKSYDFFIFDVTGVFAESGDPLISRMADSDGKVFAAKFDLKAFNRIEQTVNSPKFTNVYTGEEAFLSKEAAFIRETIGLNEDEVMVLKAGQRLENEEFFDKINDAL
jgi:drug/metabolite transporter (DMT)-like permease